MPSLSHYAILIPRGVFRRAQETAAGNVSDRFIRLAPRPRRGVEITLAALPCDALERIFSPQR
jgi:hypothetical protein